MISRMTDVTSLGTILGVWAHPDDETYLSAGLMGDAIRIGGRAVCLTATRGEEGSWDHERYPPSEMGRIREAELIAALALLGVTEHRWLDYRDGACDRVPEEEAIEKVGAVIERVAPDTVLTFGPEGLTGHSDHRAVSRWTTAAFERAAKPGAKLYYPTVTPEWADRYVTLPNGFTEVWAPGLPPLTPQAELGIDLQLADGLADLKLRALKKQISQFEPLLDHFGEDVIKPVIASETFVLAATK